jgi:hypothetical protein
MNDYQTWINYTPYRYVIVSKSNWDKIYVNANVILVTTTRLTHVWIMAERSSGLAEQMFTINPLKMNYT